MCPKILTITTGPSANQPVATLSAKLTAASGVTACQAPTSCKKAHSGMGVGRTTKTTTGTRRRRLRVPPGQGQRIPELHAAPSLLVNPVPSPPSVPPQPGVASVQSFLRLFLAAPGSASLPVQRSGRRALFSSQRSPKRRPTGRGRTRTMDRLLLDRLRGPALRSFARRPPPRAVPVPDGSPKDIFRTTLPNTQRLGRTSQPPQGLGIVTALPHKQRLPQHAAVTQVLHP